MFRLALAALLVSAVSAFAPEGSIAANSRLGQRLLSEATVIQPARFLEENQRDVSFIAGYSIRYTGCSSMSQVSMNNNNNNNNKNGNAEMVYTTHLAKFSLCPTSSCVANCVGGGEYVMSLETFVDAFTEAKLNAQEYACEVVRENCYCDEANDDEVCESACYTAAGLTGCEEVEGEGDAFEVQRYLECQDIEFNKENEAGAEQAAEADGSYAVYYVGPYCSTKNSFDIHLGVFSNQYCTAQVESSIYMNEMAYGVELPYSTTSLVDQTCIDCAKVDGNQDNNNNNAAEVSDTCEAMYNYAAKCEQKMDISSEQDNSGCEFINYVLPHVNTANKSFASNTTKGGKGAKAFAGIFAFTTALFASYAYFLYRKIKRGSVDLSSQV